MARNQCTRVRPVIAPLAICLALCFMVGAAPTHGKEGALSRREQQLEDLHSIDNVFGGTRGFITGFKQGFYKRSNIEINPQCFGQDYLVLGYNAYQIIKDMDVLWYKLYELPLKAYGFLEMIDQECDAEEFLYDMWYFCSSHNCTVDAILHNEAAHLFQITGFLNAIASIVYGHYTVAPGQETHDFYYDMYQDVGANVGRLVRVSFEYSDPNKASRREIERMYDRH